MIHVTLAPGQGAIIKKIKSSNAKFKFSLTRDWYSCIYSFIFYGFMLSEVGRPAGAGPRRYWPWNQG